MENTHPSSQNAVPPQTWHVHSGAGIFVGILVILPVITFLALADHLFGLPFVPFDVFNFVRDLLPGAVLTFGIDSMVAVLSLLRLDIDTTAKLAEQAMAVGMVIVAAAVMGGITYFAINRIKRDAISIGGSFGVAFGVAMALIVAGKNVTATAHPIASLMWVLVMFTLWGLILGWAYAKLQTIGARPIASDDDQTRSAERRKFLVQIGGASATLTVIGAGLSAFFQPEADTSDAFQVTTGETIGTSSTTDDGIYVDNLQLPTGTRPEITPLDEHYRIDISPRPPAIDAEMYRLKVHGMVEKPLEIRLSELVEAFTPITQYITLSCISNVIGGDLISTTSWTGIPLRTLMEAWKVSPLAQYVKITGADGFDEWVDLSLARTDERVMLAYAWDGQPLKQKHGFPLRIYIPDRYGMKQPKWIVEMEFMREWGEGYWVRRNWSEEALVQITSVIDSVAKEDIYERDGMYYVPIGGIAYSGAKGISAVEIRVDDGEWMPAQLKRPLSDTTWVMWRFDWAFTPGQHTFRVRTRDGKGNPQIETSRPVRPDGATGIHSRRATFDSTPEA